jgi:hypothetical protein
MQTDELMQDVICHLPNLGVGKCELPEVRWQVVEDCPSFAKFTERLLFVLKIRQLLDQLP